MAFKDCFIESCANTNKNAPKKVFLRVPLDSFTRKLWFQAANFMKKKYNHILYACEDHFELQTDCENWMFYKTIGKSLSLKKHVVPHKNLCMTSSKQSLGESQLSNSAQKRKIGNITNLIHNSSKVRKTLFKIEKVHSSSEEPTPITPPRTKHQSTNVSVSTQVYLKPSRQSVHVMTKMPIKWPTHSAENLDTRKHISQEKFVVPASTCSIESVTETFCTSHVPPSKSSCDNEPLRVKNLRNTSTIMLLECTSRFYLGLPSEVYCYVTNAERISGVISRDILITIKKIRQNDSYERLSLDFEMSKTNVQKIFTSTVPILTNIAQELIVWPDRYSIMKTLPIPFRYRYKNVQSIIDCLEIEIEKPSDPVVQALTWSEYKKCNTFKFLISSTPHGMINFISGAYSGRTSDKDIFLQSGFLDVLPEGGKVMADRGFKDVSAHLENIKSELICPLSVSAAETLTKIEARTNKTIAALRVHIERVIRRIREFKMLAPHSCVHHDLWYLMNNIIIIAASIVNVQGPLIR